MDKKFEIILSFIKDLSIETPDAETLLFVRENIDKYQLGIDISSKPLKNKMIEINTILKFEDKEESQYKSYFEMTYATIIKVDDDVNEKEELQKIILCDVQTKIYPDLEKAFLNILHNSGYKDVKFEKKIDFEKLYTEKFN